MLLLQIFLQILAARVPLKLFPMAFVFGVYDQCGRFPLEPNVGDQGLLRSNITRTPGYGPSRFMLSTRFQRRTGPQGNGLEYCFYPCFEELFHWHIPRNAFEVTQSSQSTVLDGPLDSLEAGDEVFGFQRPLKPSRQSHCRRPVYRDAANALQQ